MTKIYPIILSFVTFLATLAGGYTAAKNRSKFGYIAAFSAGILIAVPLFQLLPTSLTLAAQTNVSAQNVLYVMGLGFIFLYMLERLLSIKKSVLVIPGNMCGTAPADSTELQNWLYTVSSMAFLSGLVSTSIFRLGWLSPWQ